MLTHEQEHALERFSLERDGRRVLVKEFSNGVAVFKCDRQVRLVEENGKVTKL
jgi:hypothetical protein